MRVTDHWSVAVVRSVTELTPTVREFELVPDDGVVAFAPGSHVDVRVQLRDAHALRHETRSYSLIGRPDGHALRIAVKRMDDGRGGSRYLWTLSPGARLSISAPANHFELDLNVGCALLVAGGIGVTPIVGMAQALCARGVDVSMCYGARSASELAYLDALRSALGERLRLFLSDAGEFIDFDREFDALPPAAQVYLCGPVPMMDAARLAWSALGRPPVDLRFETFGNSGRFAPQAFTVRIAGSERQILVGRDRSLLDALEQAGVAILSDCRRGECGLCALDVVELSGEIDHRDVFLSPAEKATGRRICTCVSRVAGHEPGIVLDSGWRPDLLPGSAEPGV